MLMQGKKEETLWEKNRPYIYKKELSTLAKKELTAIWVSWAERLKVQRFYIISLFFDNNIISL
jgi:hypothetical protein